MSGIKLGALVLITKMKRRGYSTPRNVNKKGFIKRILTITTSKGEEVRYEIALVGENRIVTAAVNQFEVLGNLEDDPEMFI